MKFYLIIIALFFSLFIVLCSPQFILGQDDLKTTDFNEVVNALNRETEEIFNDYIVIVDEFEKGDENTLIKFNNKLPLWRSVLNETKLVFTKHQSTNDLQISEVSNLALEANSKAIVAIGLYEKAINSNTDTEFDSYTGDADNYFLEASDTHFKAVDLYNDYSGVSSSISIKNWLIFFSIISGLFSCLLFIKSRKKSQLEAEKIRSEIYKAFFSSSLWMTGGLVVTTVGYSYALKEGGTYYILYGPILIGGWQLLKGFSNYFTKGRKALEYLNSIQKSEAIKESYSFSENEGKTPEYICQYCGFKQTKKSVICNNCGENQL